MIPDEAVEAAAKEVYYTSGRYRSMPYAVAIRACELEALKILPAAAPFLRAQALEDAAKLLQAQADNLSAFYRDKPMGEPAKASYEAIAHDARWLNARAVTERGGE